MTDTDMRDAAKLRWRESDNLDYQTMIEALVLVAAPGALDGVDLVVRPTTPICSLLVTAPPARACTAAIRVVALPCSTGEMYLVMGNAFMMPLTMDAARDGITGGRFPWSDQKEDFEAALLSLLLSMLRDPLLADSDEAKRLIRAALLPFKRGQAPALSEDAKIIAATLARDFSEESKR